MTDVQRTPKSTLQRAGEIARAQGLRYVYTGNVHDTEGGSTFCPDCARLLVERDWHRILRYELADGRCRHCGTAIAGRFDAKAPPAVRPRRIPMRLASD
jgi:pyruvate formate lyase activating enzyme